MFSSLSLYKKHFGIFSLYPNFELSNLVMIIEDHIQESINKSVTDQNEVENHNESDTEYAYLRSNRRVENDKSEGDSMQVDDDDDYCPSESLHAEERKHARIENRSDASGEIEDRLDEFKKVIKRNLLSSHLIENNENLLSNSNLMSMGNDSSKRESKTNYEDFIREMSETEDQIKRLKNYNKSFNREMSAKFEGYNVNSDEDSYNGHYEPHNEEELSSNTSEGNLSRNEDEEDKKEDTSFKSIIKSELLQVSPDSPIEGLSRRSKHIEKMFDDIVFRRMMDEYVENKEDTNALISELSNKRQISVDNTLKYQSDRLTSNPKFGSGRKTTWSRHVAKNED